MLTNLAAVLVLWVSIPGAPPTADPGLIGDDALRQAGMTRYWDAQLPVTGKDSIKGGFLVEEALYVTTDAGTVFAVQADTGLIRWAAKLAKPYYPIYKPAHLRNDTGTGSVVIPTAGQVHVLERFSGQTVRSFGTEFPIGSAAVGTSNFLYMGGADGHFYAVAWNTPVGVNPAERWKVRVGGPVTATPVLYDRDKLIFACQDGTVYSCFASDKVLNWVFQTGGSLLGDPVVDDHGVYVASTDRSLYKLDLVTGALIWKHRTPSVLVEGPAVTSDTVYQYCPAYGLVAVDADTGREKWRDPQGRSFVADSRGRTVLATEEGNLHLVDRDTGEIKDTLEAPGVAHAVTNVRHDAVYLLDHRGRVLCARPEGVPCLEPDRVTAARARLTLPPPDEAEVGRPWEETAVEDVDLLENDPLRSRRDLRGP